MDRRADIPRVPQGYTVQWASRNDANALADVYFDAFDDSMPRRFCFPEQERRAGQAWWATEAQHWLSDPNEYYVMTVKWGRDIVAFAKWSYHPRGFRGVPAYGMPPLPRANPDVGDHFFEVIDSSRIRTHSNKPHIFLSLIGVCQAHQRQGLASILMSWGLNQADRMNLPVYLESTKMGFPVYIKKGFREVGAIAYENEVRHDSPPAVRNFHYWSSMNLVIMIRQPCAPPRRFPDRSSCGSAVRTAWGAEYDPRNPF